MKQYVVLEFHNLATLVDRANTLLAQGWELQGGIAISNFNVNATKYFQAMTKEENEEPT